MIRQKCRNCYNPKFHANEKDNQSFSLKVKAIIHAQVWKFTFWSRWRSEWLFYIQQVKWTM